MVTIESIMYMVYFIKRGSHQNVVDERILQYTLAVRQHHCNIHNLNSMHSSTICQPRSLGRM